MTTTQLLQFIRENISSISSCRIDETMLHHYTWCQAQISIVYAQGVICAADRKQLLEEVEAAKIEFFNKRGLK